MKWHLSMAFWEEESLKWKVDLLQSIKELIFSVAMK